MSRRRTGRTAKLRRRSRRRQIGMIFYRIICPMLIIGVALFATTVFFKIESIEVNGTKRYAQPQVQSVLGVEQGDSLFFWGQRTGVQRLMREYPYVSTVKIKRKLPDKLIVEIAESEAAVVLEDGGGGGLLVSSGGKLLEEVEDVQQQSLPHVTGLQLGGVRKPGETLGASSETEEGVIAFTELLSRLSENEQLKNVDFINMADPMDIHVGYLGRFDIRLGSVKELDRKLRFVTLIINDKLSPSDVGVIDLANVSRMSFWPDTLENVQAASGEAVSSVPEDEPRLPDEAGQAVEEGQTEPATDEGDGI